MGFSTVTWQQPWDLGPLFDHETPPGRGALVAKLRALARGQAVFVLEIGGGGVGFSWVEDEHILVESRRFFKNMFELSPLYVRHVCCELLQDATHCYVD